LQATKSTREDGTGSRRPLFAPSAYFAYTDVHGCSVEMTNLLPEM
jgi:hypothetical protein